MYMKKRYLIPLGLFGSSFVFFFVSSFQMTDSGPVCYDEGKRTVDDLRLVCDWNFLKILDSGTYIDGTTRSWIVSLTVFSIFLSFYAWKLINSK